MSSNPRSKSSNGNRPASRSKPTPPTSRPSSKGMSNNTQEKRQIVGQYMLGKTIGEGTFGKVKLAIHIPTGEKVAVKILEKSRIKEQADVRRVNREIKILKKARHGNIIQLYEVLDTQNTIYLIMECAEGGEMFDYIVAQKHVPEVQACKFFHQLIDGVEVLHRNEITHRDLKPENLLLKASPDGLLVKIVDFGLSNTHEGNRLLTTACGSPCYAAPEMIAGKKYNGPLADLWSIGVILFALVCGFLPFEDPNTSVLYKKILSGDYKPPKWISADVRDLISCILEVDPRKRYTIDDIRKHPWYTMVPESSVPHEAVNVYENEQTRSETLAALTDAGMDAQAVLDGVVSHACNSLTAMYYLLEQKHRAHRTRQMELGQQPQIKPNTSNVSNSSQRSAPETTGNSDAAIRNSAQAQQPTQQPLASKPVIGAPPVVGSTFQGSTAHAMVENAPALQPITHSTTTSKPNNGKVSVPINVAPYLQTPSIMQQHLNNRLQPVHVHGVPSSGMPSLDAYMKTGMGALPSVSSTTATATPPMGMNGFNPTESGTTVLEGGGLAPIIPKLKLPLPKSAGHGDGHKAVHFRNTVTSIPANKNSVMTSQTARPQPVESNIPVHTAPHSARAVLPTESQQSRVITTMNNLPVESDVPVHISHELLSMMAVAGGEETGERPNTRRSHLRSRGDEPRSFPQEAIGSLNLDDMPAPSSHANNIPVTVTTNMDSVLKAKVSPQHEVKTGSPLNSIAMQQMVTSVQQQQPVAPLTLNAQAPSLPPRSSSASGGRRGKNLTAVNSNPQQSNAPEPSAPVSNPSSHTASNPRAQAIKNKLAAQGTTVI